MERELVIALASSFASLLVALIALWQSIKFTRAQAATQKAIEAFRAGSADAQPVLVAMSDVWAHLQEMKHSVDLCLSPGRTAEQSAIESLDAAADALIAAYVEEGGDLPVYFKKICHEAKNYGVSLRASVRLNLRDTPSGQPLPDQAKARLKEARDYLTLFQSKIEEGREKYRRDMIDRVSKLLQRAENQNKK